MCRKLVVFCTVLSLLQIPVKSVDKGNFKTCDQSSFCRWVLIRNTPFTFDSDTIACMWIDNHCHINCTSGLELGWYCYELHVSSVADFRVGVVLEGNAAWNIKV